jgi:hypothetical protein
MVVSKDLLKGTAYRFNKECDNRVMEIRNCKTDTCYIVPFKNWPVSLEEGLPEEPTSEAFLHQNEYFGKTILFKTE